MENELFRHELVWAGAGSPRHIVGIAPSELMRVAQARPMDVVTEGTYDLSRPKES
jgi:prolyl-tRNA editing enzyme YbaK/EbsC (Cys-tRNA(Pro) deacylase)